MKTTPRQHHPNRRSRLARRVQAVPALDPPRTDEEIEQIVQEEIAQQGAPEDRPTEAERWRQRREAFFEEMRRIAERVNLSEEEAEQLVAEAIQAVREEERRKRAEKEQLES